MRRAGLGIILLALACSACPRSPPPAPPPPPPAAAPAPAPPPASRPMTVKFTDLHGETTGFGPVNHTGIPNDKKWIAEAMGGGVIVLDHDLDGDMDLLFVDGNVVGRAPDPEARTRLFRNDGNWKFTEVTKEAGIDITGIGYGGAAADYDGDGDPDAFVGMLGKSHLLRNNGNGTFTDVAAEAGVTGSERDMSTSCCWGDFDGDGWLDLYVATYVDMHAYIEDARSRGKKGADCDWRGFMVYCGPGGLPFQPDRLYLSKGRDPATGAVTFRDASANLLEQVPRPGFQPVAADYDQDGDLDVFTANDTEPNHLWINDGKGLFRDEGMQAGCAYNALVQAQAGMGTDVSDYDHDGRFDITMTTFSHDYYALHRNAGRPRKGGKGLLPAFEDVSVRTGISAATYIRLGWAAHFLDFDGDGNRDLFYSSGHVYGEIDNFASTGTSYRQKNVLLRSTGGESPLFENVSDRAGPGLQVQEVHRGGGQADLDDDGDPDLVVAVLNGKAYLVRNDGGNANAWIRISLKGGRPADPAGAVVKVEAAGLLPQWELAKRGDGFLSSSDPRILLGLGAAAKASKVTVTWPSGATGEWRDLDARAHWLLEEGVPDARRLPR